MADVKAAEAAVHAPVYSHQAYDILAGEFQVVDRPDILIVEGLNVLQTGETSRAAGADAPRPREAVRARVFVSDFFDFSIYIDADETHIERWYVERFLALRETVFRDPRSYFHRYASLSEMDAVATARQIWTDINGVNLRENIAPTRDRASLLLEKGADHTVERVRLRKI
jgi:type I pantothenate kinase